MNGEPGTSKPPGQRGSKRAAVVAALIPLTLLAPVVGILVYDVASYRSAVSEPLEINLAGRQRMNAERFWRQSIDGSNRQERQATLEQLLENTAVLISGGLAQVPGVGPTRIDGARNPRIERALQELSARIEALAGASAAVQGEGPPSGTALNQLEQAALATIAAADRVVSAMQQNASESLGRQTAVMKVLLVVTLILALPLALLFARERQRMIDARSEADRQADSLQSLIDNAADGVVRLDAGQRILEANAAAERILGCKPGEAVGSRMGQWLQDARTGDSEGRLHRLDTRLPNQTLEGFRSVASDGALAALEITAGACGADGHEILFMRDVSERLRAERERDQFFVQSLDLFAVADTDGYFKRVNPSFTRVLGRSEKELLEVPFLKLVHPDDVEATLSAIERLASGASVTSFENRYRRRDGDYRLLRWTAVAGADSGLIYATARDVTEESVMREALEARTVELERSAQLDRSQSEIMSILTAGEDLEGALGQVLAHVHEELGLHVGSVHLYDEWSGELALAAAHGLPTDYRRKFKLGEGLVGQAAERRETITLEGTSKHPELSLETGVGSVRAATVIVAPLVADGSALGVMTVASLDAPSDEIRRFVEWLRVQIGLSVKEHRRYEQLVEMTEQLNRRGTRIEQQAAELERANRVKSEFLANMSHELRTPLNAIIGFSEVLGDGMAGEVNAKQADYLNEIKASGSHLLSLINDVLDLSKIEAGKLELDLEAFDARELLESSLNIVREIAAEKRIKLQIEIDDGIGRIEADPRRLRQILYNLLSNAVKFTDRGGRVTLTARRMHADSAEVLEIAVADTGTGISDADQQRLFQPFEQLDGSSSRKHGGTGLGLVLVKNLAELHGGNVAVASTLGEGSTFTVRLPYREVDEGAESVQPTDRAIHPSPRAPRILLIEDHKPTAKLIQGHLERAGFNVDWVTTAEDGLASINGARRPSLIILDLVLPEAGGLQLLNSLKSDPKNAGIPVIIVSTLGDRSREQALALGAHEVIQKPVSESHLVGAIAKLGIHPDSQRSLSVLVVDDDPKAVERVAKPLEDLGVRVLRAFGGSEALDRVQRLVPDLILLDLFMPDISGFEVIARLQEQPALADVPVIVLTAKSLDPADRSALSGRVLEIIEKHHFDPAEIVTQVERILGNVLNESGLEADESPKRIKLLLIEPDPKERDRLIDCAADAGIAAVGVRDGRDAMDALRTVNPDVLAVDLSPEEVVALLEEMADQNLGTGIPLIVMAGDGSSDGFSGVTIDSFLSKPVTHESLLAAIEGLAVPTADSSPRVLVVDDDPKAVKLIGSQLRDAGFRVRESYSAREAIEQMSYSLPDLVILDLIMPEMNGFELLSKLRAMPECEDLPVVVVTSKRLTERQRRSLAESAQEIISKSQLQSVGLANVVRRSIARRKEGVRA